MTNLFRLPFRLAILLSLLLPAGGCASLITWKGTGVDVYFVQSAKLEKRSDNSILLTQQVVRERYYFPCIAAFAAERTETETYTFPAAEKDNPFIHGCTQYYFKVKLDPKAKAVCVEKDGIAFFPDTLVGPFQAEEIPSLNPDDLSRLKNAPVILRDSIGFFNNSKLLIPYRIERMPGEIVLIEAYRPLFPPVILPEENNRSYRREIDGCAIVFWKVALMPIPVLVDAATLPLQLVLLMFL